LANQDGDIRPYSLGKDGNIENSLKMASIYRFIYLFFNITILKHKLKDLE